MKATFGRVAASTLTEFHSALEFGIPRTLIRQGWRKEDLPAGATVIVDAFLAKNGTNSANANKVTLADGRQLFAGSSYGGDAAPAK